MAGVGGRLDYDNPQSEKIRELETYWQRMIRCNDAGTGGSLEVSTKLIKDY
jgi:hypothetical protein